VQSRLVEKDISLEGKKSAKEHIIDTGYEIKYGARPLRRTIQREIEDPLSMEMLKGRFNAGDRIIVHMRNGKIAFKHGPKKQKQADRQQEEQRELAASGAAHGPSGTSGDQPNSN